MNRLAILGLATAITFPALLPAESLQDFLAGKSGNLTLTSNTIYNGGAIIAPNSTLEIDGADATIDLSSGGLTNITVGANSTVVLRDAIIRNGFGFFLQNGATVRCENVFFEGGNYAALTSPATTFELVGCKINAKTEFAVNGAGGRIILTNTEISSGPGMLLAQGTSLTMTGGQILGGSGPAINSLGGGSPKPEIILDGVVIRDREVGLIAQDFDSVTIRNSSFFDCKRGMFLGNAPGRNVLIEDTVITGLGLPNNNVDKEEGANFQNVGTVTLNRMLVAHMRSGLVFVDVSSGTLLNSELFFNRKNQLNFTRTQNGLVRDTEFRGNPVLGVIDVDDFDIVYMEGSNATFDDCLILDAPDNGILVDDSSVVVRRCFIAGSRTANLATRRINSIPGSIIVSDSTIINARNQDITADRFSRIDSRRNILGTTEGFQAFPSTPSWPASEPLVQIAVQTFTRDYQILNNYMLNPGQYAIQVFNLTESPVNATGTTRFNTISLIPGRTLEGVFYNNAGSTNILTDNRIVGLTGGDNRELLVAGTSSLQEMTRNWIGQPGTSGMIHNGNAFTNAANNYWGAADGPGGNFPGSGSTIFGNNFSVEPFLTEPPMATSEGRVEVGTNGSGTGAVQTDRLRVAVDFAGTPATKPSETISSPYSALLALTDYRHPGSVPITALPPMEQGERRIYFDLWLDARLHFYTQRDQDRLTLDFSVPGSSLPVEGATLAWVAEDGSTATKNASALPGGGVARFVFASREEFPTSTMALRLFEGDGPPPPAPIVPYNATFANGALGWESSNFGIPGTTAPAFGTSANGLTISGAGSAASAGAWASPLINVTPGQMLSIRWRLRSSTAAEFTPTFRLRVGEEFFRDTQLINVESLQGGENSPGTTARDYTLLYRVPNFVTKLRVSLDLLSFNPADDLNAVLSLEQLEIQPTTAPQTGDATTYLHTFTEGTGEWTTADFGIPGTTPLTFGNSSEALTISAGGSAASAGAWVSPPINVLAGELVQVRFRLRSNTQPDQVPTFRLRVGEETFRDAAVRNSESVLAGENSPGATAVDYTMFYQVPPFAESIRLYVDMLSFNPADDLNAQLQLLEAEVKPAE